MKVKLLPPEERMRRYRIIERDINGEFWKIIKESLQVNCMVRADDALDFLVNGKEREARDAAVEVMTMRKIMDEPQKILDTNKNLFTTVYYKACDLCGTVKKMFKELAKKPGGVDDNGR